jgi:SanA protein
MWLFLFVVLPLSTVAGAGFLFYRGQTIARHIRGTCYDDVSKMPRNHVGLVLGCVRYLASGRPNRYFTYRIEAAAALLHAGKVDVLLVSGASHRKSIDEAGSMKEALIEQGVPAASIACDRFGYRTIDSVLRARMVYGQDRLTIVSQEFHNERAIYIAEHCGIQAIGLNAEDVEPPRGRMVRLREYLARMRVLVDIHLRKTKPRVLGEGEPL